VSIDVVDEYETRLMGHIIDSLLQAIDDTTIILE
jgi:hypothetical protein